MNDKKIFISTISIVGALLIGSIILNICREVVDNRDIKVKQTIIEDNAKYIDFLETNLKNTINEYEDSIFVLNNKCDSLSALNDSIMEKYMLYVYKLERINYYTKIVDNDNSQMTFYKGWIKRVLR